MFNKNIKFKNFIRKKNPKIIQFLKNIINDRNIVEKYPLLSSMNKGFQYSYPKKKIKIFKRFSEFNLIGIGGSILGAETIHNFLKHKIKKKFNFYNNLNFQNIPKTNKKKINIVISKSGNTIETIANSNIYIKKKDQNIFITENKKNYLTNLANEISAEIIEHKNFIGGRYSVLSETGMLPASLMGLDYKKFKTLNYLIKNRNFQNQLISGVSSILDFHKKKKTNSIILNYDENSRDLFYWYQQLVAESLGKKSKGVLPIISTMPKDNHSLMQLYIDGPKNNFFTFFIVEEKFSNKINKKYLSDSFSHLFNKNTYEILKAQFEATQNIFKKRKIPFRTFVVKKRDEKTLGEIFCFFILETILLGKSLNVNPYDQPSVELIKKETKKILI